MSASVPTGGLLNLYLTGDKEVVRKLTDFNPRVKAELRKGVFKLSRDLARKIKTEKLSGQVLKNRTGRLSRSVEPHIETSDTGVTGIVSTPVKYAPVHEFGFKGTVTVRAHLRQIKEAFGRPIAERQVQVREHPMRMNLPERSFLRSALAEMYASGAITAEIEADIARAME